MEAEIKSWLNEALADEHFVHFEVKLGSGTEKGDGFVGQIIFVTVEGVSKNDKPKKLELVLKASKDNQAFREDMGALAFEKEMHVYEKVFPTFEGFQNQHHVRTPFTAYPKCYKCLKLHKKEILVFENLRPLGYELHNKKICLNLDHTRIVLQEYAKLHALSFALKDQNKKKFDDLATASKDLWVDFLSKPSTLSNIDKSIQSTLRLLKDREDPQVYGKFAEILKGGTDKLVKLFGTVDEQSVWLHGDCWNNNFMFQYKNNNKTTPTAVKILDWQTSVMKTPACDLCMFLTLTSSQSAYMFDQLLREYHDQLSNFLKQLGSSPDLFTFEDLQRHWKNFLPGALMFAPLGFAFILAVKEELPEFGEMKEGSDIGDFMDMPIPETDEFYEKLKPLIEYANNL
ncbi:unnamed protein product [Acanthoscelides obtectus]|uniref:CHK kinase-like domain-containing protein n=1 Tax=Acanthoscelides obtectus TaxID=200917 RepID=A0A9P0MDV4_ACAOB|nr:unnamed protein product [Acanthoscelides obtectus]CAK1643871.1 hypothetical protein AOBTE_LOCUS13714 [Acanthoscelides obtectus]